MYINLIKIFNINNNSKTTNNNLPEKYNNCLLCHNSSLATISRKQLAFSGLPFKRIFKKTEQGITLTQGAAIILLPKHIATRIYHSYCRCFEENCNITFFTNMIDKLNKHEPLDIVDSKQLLAYVKYLFPKNPSIKLKEDLLKVFDEQEAKLIRENNEFIAGKSRLEIIEYMLRHPDFLIQSQEETTHNALLRLFNRADKAKRTPVKKPTMTDKITYDENAPEQLLELYCNKLSYTDLEEETGLKAYKIRKILRAYFMEQVNRFPELLTMINVRAQELLEKLPFDKEVYNINKISEWIKDNPELLIATNINEMRNKIKYISNAFANYGLTEKEYTDMCFNYPTLLFKDSLTIESRVKDLCRKYGLDISDYIKKCKTAPKCMTANPNYPDKSIPQLITLLKDNGYTDNMPTDFDIKKEIINAFKIEPQLFYHNADTIFEHLNELYEKLKQFNITKAECFKAYLIQPSLFEIRPDRIYENLITVCKHFGYNQCDTAEYIKFCTKSPSFLYRNPDSVISLINALIYINGKIPNVLPTYSLERLFMAKFVFKQFKKTHPQLIPELNKLSANRNYTNKQGEYIIEYYRNHPNETLTLYLPDRTGYQHCTEVLSEYSINNVRPINSPSQSGRNIFEFVKCNPDADIVQRYVVSQFCHACHIKTNEFRKDINSATKKIIDYYKKHSKSTLTIEMSSTDYEYDKEALEEFAMNNIGRNIFQFKVRA